MFRQAFKNTLNAFQGIRRKRTAQVMTTFIGLSLFQKYQRYNVLNDARTSQQQQGTGQGFQNKDVQGQTTVIEEDAIYLNKYTYMSKLLGNRHENYILIVYSEESQDDTSNSIKTAKHLKKILKQKGRDLNVYLVSRQALEDVKKMANRIMDFKIFEKEDNSQPVEVYIKTVHSNDYVYIKWQRENFFTEYKSNSFLKKLERYLTLFDNFSPTNRQDLIKQQEQQLADIMQRQYVKLNEPVILKCVNTTTPQKQQHKDIKLFKKLCFFCMERKLIPLKSRLIILENKEIMQSLNLEEGQIYILRNDMVQKLKNCNELPTNDNKKKLLIQDDFMYISNQRNSQGKNEKLAYFATRLESYSHFKNSNQKLLTSIENLSKEQGKAQTKEELEEMKEEAAFVNFAMPRITFLRDSKFGSIGKLFKKITFAKDKQVLALNLQKDDKTSNHSRIITFNKLYQQYQNDFTFLLVDTDELVDLFPHIDEHQSQFSVFNFFNIDKSKSIVGKYYKHLIFPFEKYFLQDTDNFFEDFNKLKKQVDNILLDSSKKDYVVNQQDMIPQINSETFDNLLQNSKLPFIVQIIDDTSASRLSQHTLNQLEINRLKDGHISDQEDDKFTDIKFYRMDNLNQHPLLKGRESQNGPIYLYIDPQNKQVILSPSNEQISIQNSRNEFITFLRRCQEVSTSQSQKTISISGDIKQLKIDLDSLQAQMDKDITQNKQLSDKDNNQYQQQSTNDEQVASSENTYIQPEVKEELKKIQEDINTQNILEENISKTEKQIDKNQEKNIEQVQIQIDQEQPNESNQEQHDLNKSSDQNI